METITVERKWNTFTSTPTTWGDNAPKVQELKGSVALTFPVTQLTTIMDLFPDLFDSGAEMTITNFDSQKGK